MTSVKFHLRASFSKEDRSRRLFIRMIHKRKSLSVSLPYRLYAHEWNNIKQQIIILYDSERTNYLKEVEESLKEEHRRLLLLIKAMEIHKDFNVADLKKAYLERKEGNQIASYAKKLSDELYKQGKERTARAYDSTIKQLINFVKESNITFEQITSQLLIEFECYMKEKGNSLNTISFYMRNLRSIYNKARKEDIFKSENNDIFRDVYTGIEITAKRALTKEEMLQLCNMDIKDSTLLTAFHLFLFGFLARGMSFIDMAYLKKKDIDNGIILYKRKKTGQPIEIKITDQMERLLQHFEMSTQDSPYLLPIISRKDIPIRLQYESALRLQNKRLKKLAEMCGIRKTFSTHVARHSWASMAKMINLPLTVISEGLGHTSVKTTSIYLASFNRSVLDRANEKVSRFVSHII